MKVAVGMSGGVDSAVAAALLVEEGYEVVGLFMNNWEDKDGTCPADEDWADARLSADKLGIPVYSVDFSAEYYSRVFEEFLAEYRAGRTPNPDVLCNREIKFDALKKYAEKLGAERIATGHYCGIGEMSGLPVLLRAADLNKDQTYFLCQVKTEQLRGVMFPLSRLRKPEVRALAGRYGLTDVEKKKDSTGICFIGERNFRRFLSEYLPALPGDITDEEGNVVGRHEGLMYYTLGQRRGLGIGGLKGRQQARWFVVAKDLEHNRLIVSCGEDDRLYSSRLTAHDMNIIGPPIEKSTLRCTARTRYRQPDTACTVTFLGDGRAEVVFDEPRRAVTPGQYVVLYDGERCLGGGVID